MTWTKYYFPKEKGAHLRSEQSEAWKLNPLKLFSPDNPNTSTGAGSEYAPAWLIVMIFVTVKSSGREEGGAEGLGSRSQETCIVFAITIHSSLHYLTILSNINVIMTVVSCRRNTTQSRVTFSPVRALNIVLFWPSNWKQLIIIVILKFIIFILTNFIIILILIFLTGRSTTNVLHTHAPKTACNDPTNSPTDNFSLLGPPVNTTSARPWPSKNPQ